MHIELIFGFLAANNRETEEQRKEDQRSTVKEFLSNLINLEWYVGVITIK